MRLDIRKVDRLFDSAEKDGRSFLLEHEVYAALKAAGIGVPRWTFVPAGTRPSREAIARLGAEKVVVKVVSPLIMHKSDVGGVAFAKADPASVAKVCTAMTRTVPGRFLRWEKAQSRPGAPQAPGLREVRDSIRGFLVVEKVGFLEAGFGSEILLGVRNSRDFGPVLTMGAGGLDVEYMNERLKEGVAAALGAAHLLTDDEVPGLLSPLAFFGKVAAEFRGRKPLVRASALADAFLRFRDLAVAFSPFSTESPFVIEEAEVNPFVIRAGKLVPLDGVCRFSRDKRDVSERPGAAIRNLLRPESIGIIGVSEKMNVGHIILNNILKNGFPPSGVVVVKPGAAEIEGCRCVPSVRDIPRTVDLFVLTLAADQCYDVMKDIVDGVKARSVIIIAGGMGEKAGGEGIEEKIRALLSEARTADRPAPVINGGNCLGIYSKPGRYDTTFIPDWKLVRPKSSDSGLAVVSQSGAFMICRMSNIPTVEPVYAVSLGNQLDLTASDYIHYLNRDPAVRTIAVYMEGFRPGDGHAFAREVREATASGRSVLVYKSGRSPEGRAATSSHTASVAGDYGVFRAVLEQAGAVVASDLVEYESFLKALVLLEGRAVRGRRVGLQSNAGFECVVMADNLKNGAGLELARFDAATVARILDVLKPLGIDRLLDVHNPLDVTPVADDRAFCEAARAVIEDPEVDCALVSNVPLTPAQQTLAPGPGHREDFAAPGSFGSRMVELFKGTDKPVIAAIDSGELYTPLAAYLEANGIPVFRRSDQAVRFLRAFVDARLKAAE